MTSQATEPPVNSYFITTPIYYVNAPDYRAKERFD